MHNLLRQSYLLVCSLVLGCVIIGLLAASPARADVGVQPVFPGGSSIKPEEETPIQMTSEVIVMNVRSATEADNALIQLAPKYYGFHVIALVIVGFLAWKRLRKRAE